MENYNHDAKNTHKAIGINPDEFDFALKTIFDIKNIINEESKISILVEKIENMIKIKNSDSDLLMRFCIYYTIDTLIENYKQFLEKRTEIMDKIQ